jgi:hypothetical protein
MLRPPALLFSLAATVCGLVRIVICAMMNKADYMGNAVAGLK